MNELFEKAALATIYLDTVSKVVQYFLKVHTYQSIRDMRAAVRLFELGLCSAISEKLSCRYILIAATPRISSPHFAA